MTIANDDVYWRWFKGGTVGKRRKNVLLLLIPGWHDGRLLIYEVYVLPVVVSTGARFVVTDRNSTSIIRQFSCCSANTSPLASFSDSYTNLAHPSSFCGRPLDRSD